MTTNTTAAENYYRIKFQGLPHDLYEYGATALEAIATARHDLTEWDIKDNPTTLGNATARPAVYGEWDCSPHHFHNDGTHSHDYKMEA